MEKKSRRSLTVEDTGLMLGTIELVGGLYFDAFILPISSLVELTGGLYQDMPLETIGMGITLTGGSWDDA